MSSTGQPLDRVDGRLKITGQAKYTADIPAARMVYGAFVGSTITRGKIMRIDSREARKLPGVVAILTHESGLKLKPAFTDMKSGAMSGDGTWLPLQDAQVHFNGQAIGLVLAESIEVAHEAASRVRVTYEVEKSNVEMAKAGDTESKPDQFFGQDLQYTRGNPDEAFRQPGVVSIEETYTTPVEHHNPMEPHASVAVWEGHQLTVYDTTQAVDGTKKLLAHILDVKEDDVRVVSHFLGGGFGCKGFFWNRAAIAAAAARHIHRPVHLELTRDQMFTMNGHRTPTVQKMHLAATSDGKLVALSHDARTQTSQIAKFVEPCVFLTKMLYAVPNLRVSQTLVKVDTGTPTPMRAPGESVGTFALESALDELAYKLKMDPIDLRLANYAEKDPESGKAWSSKLLRECYKEGAERFGWSKRDRAVGSMRDGRLLVGYGVATATYPGNRSGAGARVVIAPDGHAVVSSAAHDIGTGTYTIMTQIAADALGISPDDIQFELGNTDYPDAPVAGGSQTAASVGPAVRQACEEARRKLIELASGDPASPLHGQKEISIKSGRLVSSGASENIADLLKRNNLEQVVAEKKLDATTRGKPSPTDNSPKQSATTVGNPDLAKYSFHSFGAQFAEVRVDPDTGEVRVKRMLGAFDIGRVLNPKTARSQALGGITWGLGMALMEESIFDTVSGRMVTRNLADYRVPVHADSPEIDVWFTDQPDLNMSEIGARGVGEIGITGAAAAIANAVYHATGKRIRDLPIAPEKVI